VDFLIIWSLFLALEPFRDIMKSLLSFCGFDDNGMSRDDTALFAMFWARSCWSWKLA